MKAMIRVDHAGEAGAVQIYKGQLAALGNSPLKDKITQMLSHEQAHLDQFDALMKEHRARPTLLSPLWHVGAYALGYVTGRLGDKAALACTVAVEEVIDDHYERQKTQLIDDTQKCARSEKLLETITSCQAEEVLHKNIALELGAKHAPAYDLLTKTIRGLTKGAVWLSTRL